MRIHAHRQITARPTLPRHMPRARVRGSTEPEALSAQLHKLGSLSVHAIEQLTLCGIYDRLLAAHRDNAMAPETVVEWLRGGIQRVEAAVERRSCEDAKFSGRLLEQLTRFAVQQYTLHLPFWLVGRCRQVLAKCGGLLSAPNALTRGDRHDLNLAADDLMAIAAAVVPYCFPSMKAHRWHPVALLESRHPDMALAFANDYRLELVPQPLRPTFLSEVVSAILASPAAVTRSVAAKAQTDRNDRLHQRLWRETYQTALQAMLAQLGHLVIANDPGAQTTVLAQRKVLASPAIYCLGGYLQTLSTVGHVTYQSASMLHDISAVRAVLLGDLLKLALGTYNEWVQCNAGDEPWVAENAAVVRTSRPAELKKRDKPLMLQDRIFDDLTCFLVVNILTHESAFRVGGFNSPNPNLISDPQLRSRATMVLQRLPLIRQQAIARKIMEHTPVQVMDYHHSSAVGDMLEACESMFNARLGIDPFEADLE